MFSNSTKQLSLPSMGTAITPSVSKKVSHQKCRVVLNGENVGMIKEFSMEFGLNFSSKFTIKRPVFSNSKSLLSLFKKNKENKIKIVFIKEDANNDSVRETYILKEPKIFSYNRRISVDERCLSEIDIEIISLQGNLNFKQEEDDE